MNNEILYLYLKDIKYLEEKMSNVLKNHRLQIPNNPLEENIVNNKVFNESTKKE